MVRFFHNLLIDRSSQFILETKCQDSGMENQTIPQVKKGRDFGQTAGNGQKSREENGRKIPLVKRADGAQLKKE